MKALFTNIYKPLKWLFNFTWKSSIVVLTVIAALVFSEVILGVDVDELFSSPWGYDTMFNDNLEVRKHRSDYNVALFNARGRKVSPTMSEIYTDAYNPNRFYLVLFKTLDGKYGFLNRESGKVAIPAKYDDAFLFSEQLAAVKEDGRLKFINPDGEVQLDGGWLLQEGIYPVFHNGYAPVVDKDGKAGLIDIHGQWVNGPCYDSISWLGCDSDQAYWRVGIKDEYGNYSYGLLDDKCKELFPPAYRHISLDDNDGTVFLATEDGMTQVRTDGTLVNSFVVDSIEPIQIPYLGYECDPESEDSTYASDRYAIYSVFNREGLFDMKQAKPVTAPIYRYITSVSDKLFKCELPRTDKFIVIDADGRIVK